MFIEYEEDLDKNSNFNEKVSDQIEEEESDNEEINKKSNMENENAKLKKLIQIQNKEIKSKDKQIKELKLLINMNQNQINRLNSENFGLKKQLNEYESESSKNHDRIKTNDQDNFISSNE